LGEKTEALGSKSAQTSFAAEVQGRWSDLFLGYQRLEFGVPDTIGWIDTIGVDPLQKKGIATALADELIGAEGVGVKTVYTLVIGTTGLLQFFHAMGWQGI